MIIGDTGLSVGTVDADDPINEDCAGMFRRVRRRAGGALERGDRDLLAALPANGECVGRAHRLRREPGPVRRDSRLAVVTELRVVVPDEVAEQLARRAEADGVTPEEAAAEAVGTYVGRRRRLAFAGTLHSGRGDLAERAEEILRTEPAS